MAYHGPVVNEQLVGFRSLAGVLARVGGVFAALALAGTIAEGLIAGLTFAVLFRWAALFVTALLGAATLISAGYAVLAMRRAQRSGQRLSDRDVGLLPSRRERS